MTRAEEHAKRMRRVRNIFLVTVSLYIAFELYRTGAIAEWLLAATLHVVPGSFIAGTFFTSLFTVAPASVVLAEMGSIFPPVLVAAIGAGGAVLGDFFLFMFVRDAAARGAPLFFNTSQRRRIKHVFRHPLLHWLLPLCGAFFIALPLPNEFGLALMGLSRMPVALFIPISYAMNFLGILAVALIGQAVL